MQVDIIKEVKSPNTSTPTAAKPKSADFVSTLRDCEAKADGRAKENKNTGDDNTTVAILGALAAMPMMTSNVAVEKVMPITTVTYVGGIVEAPENPASMQSSLQQSAEPTPLTTMDPGFSQLIKTPVIPKPQQEPVIEEAVPQATDFTVPDVKIKTDAAIKPADVSNIEREVTFTAVEPKEQPQVTVTEQPVVKNAEVPPQEVGITASVTVLPDKETPVVTAPRPKLAVETAEEPSPQSTVTTVSSDDSQKAPITASKSDEAKDSGAQHKDSNSFETATAAAASNTPVMRTESPEKFPKALKADTANQISDAVRQAYDTGRTEVKIHLNPEELGPISIKIVSQNGVFSVQISADNRSTGQLIASSMHELTQSMQDRGITMDKAEVSYAGSTLDASTGGQQQSSQYQGSGNDASDYSVPKWTVAMETGGKTAHDAVAAKPEEPDIKPIGDDSSISMLV